VSLFSTSIPINRSGTWREYRARPSGWISVYDCRVEYDYRVNRVVDKCTLVEQKKSLFIDYIIMIKLIKDNLTLVVPIL
jgi:hypothetical protein